jgi:hypothetical protein
MNQRHQKRSRGLARKAQGEQGRAFWKLLATVALGLGTTIGTGFFLKQANAGPAVSVQVQTPATNEANVATLKMIQPRYGHTATALPDGRILITGGLQSLSTDNPQPATINEIFDPTTGVFSAYEGDLPDPLGAAAAETHTVTVSNGGALTFGLDAVTFSWQDIGSFIFQSAPTDGSEPVITEIPVPADANLSALQRAYATATPLTQTSIYDSGNAQINSYNRLLIAGGINANGEPTDAAVFNPARLATDKDDYAPGEVVWLSGSGWKPGEEVNIWVVDSNGWEYKATLTADVNGRFPQEQPLFDVMDEHLGGAFDLTAIGADSDLVSSVHFTDANSQTVVTSNLNPSTYGHSVSFTATVSKQGGGAGTGAPTGTVTFKEGSTTLATAPLVAGSGNSAAATFTTSTLSAGLHSITAVYAGDATYVGSTSAVFSQNVNPKALTVTGITAGSRPYNGTTAATLNLAGASLVGVVGSDSVSLNTSLATGSFADKNVGNGKTVTISGLSLTGPQAGNYTLTQPTATANITARDLTVTATASNKPYDGNTTASVTLSTDKLSGDTVSAAYTTATFADKNVGVGKTVTVNGISISGGDAGNYNLLNTSAATTANITAIDLTVTATGVNKPYDGNADAAVTLSTDKLSGDAVTANYTSASFNNKNVGTSKPVSVSGISITGADAANYNLLNTTAATTADITVRDLTVTATGINKPYDGNANATVTLTSDEVVGDGVTASYTTASFGDKNVGTGKPVNVSGISISGSDAINYNLLNNIAATIADITVRDLTVTATGVNKPYDGNANATVTLTSDEVAGDAVTANYTSASFDDKNVGTGKPVSVSGISITGADAGNYNLLNNTASTTADITALDLTVTATGVNKPYDGNTTATVTLSTDKLSGDVVTAAYTTATFADKNAGVGKTITVNGISISGADAGNYNLLNITATTSADITVRDLTVTATGISKPYDGNANATVTLSTDKLGSDTVTANYTTASFVDKNVGTGKSVSVSGISITGADSANYNLLNSTAATTANITARDLTVTATGVDKPYDGNANATVTLASDKLGGDDVTANYTSASFNNKNVGIAKPVNVSGISITGTDAGNYNLLNTTAATTANITALHVIGAFTADNKVYDGNASAAVLTRSPGAILGGDDVSLSGGTATFDNKNVGNGKTVTLVGATLVGDDASNYILDGVSTTTANITERHVTGSFTADNKVYDGTTSAIVLTRSPGAVIGGDAVSLTGGVATFDTKDVANGKTVTLAGATLTGGDAGNYILDGVSTTTANITPRALTITANNQTKTAGQLFTFVGNEFTTGAGQLVGTDSVTSVTLTSAGTPAAALGGSYPIIASAAVGSGLSNYAIAYVNGTLTVNYNFSGFFQPVDNLGVVNKAKAGSAIPVKFSLHGYFGLNIFATGYPSAVGVAIPNTSLASDITETVTASTSGLVYDATADQYVYVWKTDKNWVGKGIRLTVKLTDGTTMSADFAFSK